MRLVRFFFILLLILAACYGLFVVYNIAIEDATNRIRQGVAKGVGKGIKDMINPFKW